MKDIKDLIDFLISKSTVLVTILLVSIVVLLLFINDFLKIDPPFVYIAYIIFLAGITAGTFLLLGMVVALWELLVNSISSVVERRRDDRRALNNLATISRRHAEFLAWIVRRFGERFSTWRVPELEELVDHGFLIFDDPATRHAGQTYFRVRKVIWDRVSAPDYEWGWRIVLGQEPPWDRRF